IEQLQPDGIVLVVEHGLRVIRQPGLVESHNVSHQADVDEIYRLVQPFAQRIDLAVFYFVEIGEDVRAASGEEHFAGVARIFAIQRLVEQAFEIQGGIRLYRFGSPTGDWIRRSLNQLRESRWVEFVEFVIELGNQFQIMSQRSQLCGAAQFELHSLIKIERLI